MSRSAYEPKMALKKGLHRICYISEAALSVAAGVFGWLNPGATLLGATVATPIIGLAKESINSWDVSGNLEDEYFEAVEAALENAKQHFLNKPSKLALLNELSSFADEMDMDLATIIKNTETFQTQYMTMLDTREILVVFESAFDQELVKHDKLSRYYSIKTGKNTLDLLKHVHIIVTTDSKKLDQIFVYVKETSDATAQIKSDVHQIKTGMEYLKHIGHSIQNVLCYFAEISLQSMVIFFSFTIATALLNMQTERTMEIYVVVLISELLIRSLSVRAVGFKATSSAIITQMLFTQTSHLRIPPYFQFATS